MKSAALAITKEEWNDVAFLKAIDKAFVSKRILGSDFANVVYGAKFDMYEPGKEVLVYTLVSTYSDRETVLILVRENGVFKEMKNGKVIALE